MDSKTILIVEDDAILNDMYSKKFKFDGFKVLNAYDGEEALEKLLSEQNKPAVIMLDIMLPKMDGFDVLKKIKENSNTKDIPVVLSTNLGSSGNEAKKGKKLGAAGFLVKSEYTLNQIVEKVKKYVK